MNNYTRKTQDENRIVLDKLINVCEKLILLDDIDELTNIILQISANQIISALAQKLFDKDRVELFSAIVPELTAEEKLYFLEKTINEENTVYFGILIGYIDKNDYERILYELYDKNEIVFFSTMIYSAEERVKSSFRVIIENDKKELFTQLNF